MSDRLSIYNSNLKFPLLHRELVVKKKKERKLTICAAVSSMLLFLGGTGFLIYRYLSRD